MDQFLSRLDCRKVGENQYILRYYNQLTKGSRRVFGENGAVFATRSDALDWARLNQKSIVQEIEGNSGRHEWRLNRPIFERYKEYSAWKCKTSPRSATTHLSALRNYGLLFFVGFLKKKPNEWYRYECEFIEWLQNRSNSKTGRPLALNTINGAINAINSFMKWLNKRNQIDNLSYRKFETLPSDYSDRRSVSDLISEDDSWKIYTWLQGRSSLYADKWYVQYRLATRITENLGLSIDAVLEGCPTFIKEEFEAAGLKVYGSVYLESQPSKPYISREADGTIKHVPLKRRKGIGPAFGRTIPVTDEKCWEILSKRVLEQIENWQSRKYGENKGSYLIFEGAQAKPYRALLRQACESLGIDYRGTHIVRHGLSTAWGEVKMSSKVVELVLGHRGKAAERYHLVVEKVNSERTKPLSTLMLRKNVEDSRAFG